MSNLLYLMLLIVVGYCIDRIPKLITWVRFPSPAPLIFNQLYNSCPIRYKRWFTHGPIFTKSEKQSISHILEFIYLYLSPYAMQILSHLSAAYRAAKGGLIVMAKAMANDHGRDGEWWRYRWIASVGRCDPKKPRRT
jgi:hypothetical protein